MLDFGRRQVSAAGDVEKTLLCVERQKWCSKLALLTNGSLLRYCHYNMNGLILISAPLELMDASTAAQATVVNLFYRKEVGWS